MEEYEREGLDGPRRLAEVLENTQRLLGQAGEMAAQATSQAEEVADSVKRAASELVDLQSKAEAARAHAAEILALSTSAKDLQGVIAAKSDHIEQAQVHADKVRSNLDRLHTQATQKFGEVEATAENARARADSAVEHQAAAKVARAAVEADQQAADESVRKLDEVLERLKKFSADAERADQRVATYEKKLEEFQKQVEDRIAIIDSLLPGATSAGLATAFDERRKTFLNPSSRWQWVFVASLAILVAIACTGLWQVLTASTAMSYDELVRLWLARLPIAGALIWLAMYASRESSLAKRLEEDYGYKAAIAASFQGFHKQMSDITERAEAGSPVSKLCADTLTTIATPPGRIYDKHNLTVSPSGEVTEMLKTLIAKQADRDKKGNS